MTSSFLTGDHGDPARNAGRKKAYKPRGIKFGNLVAAIGSVGQPTQIWSYFVPWTDIHSRVLRSDKPDGSKTFRVLNEHKKSWYIDWPEPTYTLYQRHFVIKDDTIFV